MGAAKVAPAASAGGDLWVLKCVRDPDLTRRWRHSGGRTGHLALALV